MTWHYAARKTKDFAGEDLYDLVEVYRSGDTVGWTENAVSVSGASREELAKWLRRAADDVLSRAVIDEAMEEG